jgi:hypothetical protein
MIDEMIIFRWAFMSIEVDITPETQGYIVILPVTTSKMNLWIGLARGKLFR